MILSSLKDTGFLNPQIFVMVKTLKWEGKHVGDFIFPRKKPKNLRISGSKKDSEKETEIKFLVLRALVNTLSKYLYYLERLYSKTKGDCK